jgi:integrase
MTVGALIERWLEDTVRGSVRQSTYQRDESLCRVHIIPALGKNKLKALNAADVQRFYCAKLDSGLSSATVHKLHVLLHKSLKQVVRWRLAPRNVADDVDAPKVHKEEVHPLTNEQARKLVDTAQGDRLEALYVVAVQSGLRQGELLALKWEDVDFEARTVQVRRTLTRDGGKLAIGPAKTAKGRRTAATILLLKNVNPKVVSEMLGHATIAITLDTYSHVLPNMQHSAVAAMEEAFS